MPEVHRGQGIGRLLLEAGEKWATGQGYSDFTVRSNIKRTDAHAFYEKNGYGIIKTSHVFGKEMA
jgi:GNAT superfamily N-acetyltransferase